MPPFDTKKSPWWREIKCLKQHKFHIPLNNCYWSWNWGNKHESQQFLSRLDIFLILTVRQKSVNIFPVPVIKSCWLNATLSGYSVNMHHVTISATLSIASFIGYCKFAQDTGSKFHSCQHSSIVLLETNTNSVLSQLHPQKCQKGGR